MKFRTPVMVVSRRRYEALVDRIEDLEDESSVAKRTPGDTVPAAEVRERLGL